MSPAAVSEVGEFRAPAPEQITDAEWTRVLAGQPFRVLVKSEQLEWASSRGLAVRCVACIHAPGETHDPWGGFCQAHRVAVSNTFPKLCRRFERRA
jgi:hypothetical protein